MLDVRCVLLVTRKNGGKEGDIMKKNGGDMGNWLALWSAIINNITSKEALKNQGIYSDKNYLKKEELRKESQNETQSVENKQLQGN